MNNPFARDEGVVSLFLWLVAWWSPGRVALMFPAVSCAMTAMRFLIQHRVHQHHHLTPTITPYFESLHVIDAKLLRSSVSPVPPNNHHAKHSEKHWRAV